MKILINIAKYLTAISVVTAAVWGGFKLYDNIIDGQKDILDEVVILKSQQGIIIGNVTDNKLEVQKILDHQKVQDSHMKSMENAAKFYINHQQKITEDAMQDALEILLKKNEDLTVYGETPHKTPE